MEHHNQKINKRKKIKKEPVLHLQTQQDFFNWYSSALRAQRQAIFEELETLKRK